MSDRAVVVCTWALGDDGLPDEVAEALTFARGLEAYSQGGVALAVLGPVSDAAAAEAERYGATAIDKIEDAKLEGFPPDACVAALSAYVEQCSPRVVLFAQTFDARLVAPRLAGRLGASVVMNTVELAADGDGFAATACAYGGDTRVVYECAGGAPYIFAINPNAILAEPLPEPGAAPLSDVAVDLSAVSERVRVVERAEAAEGPRLEHAQVIVAGGRGLGESSNFRLIEELAEALGGMAAASRPIVDEGWATPAQQVGLTGKITKPALYVAAGISGASQHMVGCTAAKTLVAVNRDRDAAVFRYADFGIVGDCLEILPELVRAVRSQA